MARSRGSESAGSFGSTDRFSTRSSQRTKFYRSPIPKRLMIPMENKPKHNILPWAIQSFLLCVLFNLAFTAFIFFMADKTLGALNEWVSPLTGPGAPALPHDAQTALGGLGTLMAQVRGYLPEVLAALASALTLLLWFFIFLTGRRQIGRAERRAEPSGGQKA